MIMLNRAPSAEAMEAAVGIEGRLARRRRPLRFVLLPLAVLIAIAGASWPVPQARAHNTSSGSFRSSMGGGRIASGTMMGSRQRSAQHDRGVFSLRRFPFRHDEAEGREHFDRARDFRRFHRRDREFLADAFFPWGFGWPSVQSDFAGAPAEDSGDGIDWRNLPFWRQFDRYQPPTVEKSPSGVTIIRGPGSHHGFAPP